MEYKYDIIITIIKDIFIFIEMRRLAILKRYSK